MADETKPVAAEPIQAGQPAKKAKKPVDTVSSVDHANGVIVVDTDRADGESVKAVCNGHQRTTAVTGGQLWFRFDEPIPHLYSLVID